LGGRALLAARRSPLAARRSLLLSFEKKKNEIAENNTSGVLFIKI
jgi:hypothetical protein